MQETGYNTTITEPDSDLDERRTLEVDSALTESMWQFLDKTKSILLTDNNEVYSPASLYSALSLLIPAAKKESKENLLSGLSLENPAHLTNFFKRHNFLSDEFSSLLTNSIWYGTQEDFSESIKNELIEDYIVSTHQADFTQEQQTSDQIKKFIDDRTNGFIKNLNVKVNPESSLILLNTLYLKDLWSNEFFKETTINFTTADNETLEVKGSKVTVENTNHYFQEPQAQMLYYPLRNTGGVLFIKPTQDVDAYLNEVNLMDVYSKLENINDETRYDVSFEMPHVDISSRIGKINQFLKPLGFEDILSDEPDMSYLESETPQFVSDIIQQARITVDNKGVEAAAYTQVEVDTTSVMPQEVEKVEFILDKPYVMIVLDSYHNPMFISRVVNPNQLDQ